MGDDELPPISLKTSRSGDFKMPSADVLASQRAREEECEEELRQLRSQYENEQIIKSITSQDSSGSEGESTLAAAVEALKVETTQSELELDAADLLKMIILQLPSHDTSFISDYLASLEKQDVVSIKTLTTEIINSIEDWLRAIPQENKVLTDTEAVVTGCWLFAASLWRFPHVIGARRALHCIVSYFTQPQAVAVGGAMAASLRTASTLLVAADVVRDVATDYHISSPHTMIASLLLRATLATLTNTTLQLSNPSPLTVEELASALSVGWLEIPAGGRVCAGTLAGRVLAAGEGGEPRRRLLALLAAPPPHYTRHDLDYHKVMVAVSRLQSMFRESS